MKRWLLPGLLMAIAACGGGPEGESVPDTRIGLVEGDVFDVPTPPAATAEASEPGEGTPATRVSEDLPPVIPHAVGDYLPIAREENYCVECHAVAEKVEGEPTPIPVSHYTDLRNAPDRKQEAVVGARWNCVACHVSRTDAQPLVANTFGS